MTLHTAVGVQDGACAQFLLEMHHLDLLPWQQVYSMQQHCSAAGLTNVYVTSCKSKL